MAKKKSKNSNVMAYDLFEREYEQAIEWRTEQILGNGPYGNDYEAAHDAAFEQAIEEVAAENGITLI